MSWARKQFIKRILCLNYKNYFTSLVGKFLHEMTKNLEEYAKFYEFHVYTATYSLIISGHINTDIDLYGHLWLNYKRPYKLARSPS